MTILASIMTLPVSLALEGGSILPTLKAISSSGQAKTLAVQTLLSGLYYYAYNEVAFQALDNVAPVTHALGKFFLQVRTD